VFRGTYEHAIDAKGRTSFPSKFRELLPAGERSKLMLTTSLDSPCLVAYSLSAWEAFEERLKGLPQFDRAVQDLKRMYVASAADPDIDQVGRLLIPSALREHANLKRDVVWAGNVTYVELWDKDTFAAARAAIAQSPERRLEVAKRLSELGL
jgi:MraZ protein